MFVSSWSQKCEELLRCWPAIVSMPYLTFTKPFPIPCRNIRCTDIPTDGSDNDEFFDRKWVLTKCTVGHPYLCMPPHIFSHRLHFISKNWLKCSETVQVPWTFCRMIRDLLVNSQHCKLLMYSKRRFRDMVQKCNDWLDRITRSNQVSIRCLVCFIIHMKIGRDFALQSKLKM